MFDLTEREKILRGLSQMTFKVELITSFDKTGEELEAFLQEVVRKGLIAMQEEGNKVLFRQHHIRIQFQETITQKLLHKSYLEI